MPEFGDNFKKARESKELTLDQIAAETRVKTRFLKAIEEEEFALLPGGIVARGFVRTYATSLGLDPEQAIAEFDRLSQYREPPLSEGFRTSSAPSKDNVTRNFYPIAAGILVLLIVIFYVVTRESGSSVTAIPAPKAATAPLPAPSPPPVLSSDIAPTTAEAAAPETTTAPAASPNTVSPPAAAPASGAINLEIETQEDTWITLKADGASVVTSKVLHPGDAPRYSADHTMTLLVGNAGGVRIKVNGQDYPALGQHGQVRSVTFTPETLKKTVP